MRLSKEIYNLQRRRNKRKSNGVILKMMMSRMKIDLNVLSSFMKNRVVSNPNRILVVTIHSSRMRKRYSHICIVTTKILFGNKCRIKIFYFSWRLKNNGLFLTLPRNKRITWKDTETSKKLVICRIIVMINIKVCMQLQGRGGWM